MIDHQLIEMIDDPNPKVRAEAVKQLAKTRSHEAVQYLAAIYKTDSDPEIRELARKAGLYIKKKQAEDQWTGGDADPDSYEDEAPKRKEVQVSQRAQDTAKSYMENAMNLHVAGDDEKATKSLMKAFKANPNLQFDSYSVGLAATIMDMPGEKATAILVGDVDYGEGDVPKKKRKNDDPDEVSTEKVMIDLLIYGIVIFALVLVGMLILMSLFGNLIQTAIAESPELAAAMSSSEYADETQFAFDLINGIVQNGGVISIATAVAVSIYSVIALLIQFACMHVAATMIMGGEGTYKALVHKVTGVLTIFSVLYVLLSGYMIYAYVDASISENFSSFSTATAVSGVAALLSIGYLIWFVGAIGSVYKFGSGKGCLSFILGSIIFGFLNAIVSGVLGAAITPLLFSMMGVPMTPTF